MAPGIVLVTLVLAPRFPPYPSFSKSQCTDLFTLHFPGFLAPQQPESFLHLIRSWEVHMWILFSRLDFGGEGLTPWFSVLPRSFPFLLLSLRWYLWSHHVPRGWGQGLLASPLSTRTQCALISSFGGAGPAFHRGPSVCSFLDISVTCQEGPLGTFITCKELFSPLYSPRSMLLVLDGVRESLIFSIWEKSER